MNDKLRVKNNELGGKMKYRYRTDEEMKDSGIEWIGTIPKAWNLSKIKFYTEVKSGEYLSKDDYVDNGIYPVYGSNGQIGFTDKKNNENKCIIVGRVGACGEINTANKGWITDNALIVNSYSEKSSLDFIKYYFNNVDFKSMSTGTAQQIITGTQLKNIEYPIFALNEQNKISKFLDKKTAQFDSIISKKEALIEKLEEAKKSLISEVVTGKVRVVKTDDGYELVERTKEEMKDSGVEWLGDNPKEWDLKRSNYVFKFSKGLSITKENLQDEGIPCINYGEIHSKYGFEVNPKRHKLKCVTEEYFNSNPNALIKYGDFVFADTSEDIQGCGNFSYLNAEDSIFAGYHTIIARPIKTVSSRYLAYLFDSDDWRIQIRTKVSGIKVFSITQSILKTTKVILPTLSEQKLIVDYLDNKFVNINSMINNMKKQIEKLKEAKQSLISEAVTGKIEILD